MGSEPSSHSRRVPVRIEVDAGPWAFAKRDWQSNATGEYVDNSGCIFEKSMFTYDLACVFIAHVLFLS